MSSISNSESPRPNTPAKEAKDPKPAPATKEGKDSKLATAKEKSLAKPFVFTPISANGIFTEMKRWRSVSTERASKVWSLVFGRDVPSEMTKDQLIFELVGRSVPAFSTKTIDALALGTPIIPRDRMESSLDDAPISGPSNSGPGACPIVPTSAVAEESEYEPPLSPESESEAPAATPSKLKARLPKTRAKNPVHEPDAMTDVSDDEIPTAPPASRRARRARRRSSPRSPISSSRSRSPSPWRARKRSRSPPPSPAVDGSIKRRKTQGTPSQAQALPLEARVAAVEAALAALIPAALPALPDPKAAAERMDRGIPKSARDAIANRLFVPLAELLPALPRERTVVANSTSLELSMSTTSSARRSISSERELHRATGLLRSCIAAAWGHGSAPALAVEAYGQYLFVLEASLSLRGIFLADHIMRSEAARGPSVLWPLSPAAATRIAQIQAQFPAQSPGCPVCPEGRHSLSECPALAEAGSAPPPEPHARPFRASAADLAPTGRTRSTPSQPSATVRRSIGCIAWNAGNCSAVCAYRRPHECLGCGREHRYLRDLCRTPLPQHIQERLTAYLTKHQGAGNRR